MENMFDSYFVLIYYFLLLFISKLLTRESLSSFVICIYIIWWGTLIYCSTFNFYFLLPISNKSYFILLLSTTSFIIGFLLAKTKHKKQYEYLSCDFNILKSEISTCYKIVLMVSLVYIGYLAVRYYSLLLIYSAGEARGIRYTLDFFDSRLLAILFVYFHAFFLFAVMRLIYMIMFFKKYNKWVFLTATYVILFCFVGTGRYQLLYVLFVALLFHKYEPRFMELRHRSKFASILVIVMMAFGLVFFGILRSSSLDYEFENFLISCVHYINGPFRLLDLGIDDTAYLNQLGYPCYGTASMGGFVEIFAPLFIACGIRSNSADIVQILNENVMSITDYVTTYYNYSYTAFFTYYLDFGLIGCFFIPMLFGYLLRKSLCDYIRNRDFYSFCIFVYLFFVSITSFFSWDFMQSPSAIFCVTIYFLMYRNKKMAVRSYRKL